MSTFSKTSKGSGAGLLVSVMLLLTLFASAAVYAQVVGGLLSGTVTDQSGAVIPGAQISIKNVATGVTTNATTDAAGFYAAANLLPGTYDVTTEASGFSTKVETGVTITVGSKEVLNLALRVGRVTETVQVAGQAAAVQLATSSVSAEVNSTTVRELPLNGRSWTDLANLQPGVTALTTQPAFTGSTAGSTARGNRGYGAQLSISGGRPVQNNYRLDGISINDYANGAPGSVLGVSLGVDAIQEFSVLTSNYSTEYGRTSGGVVNAITRSGTNQFHGDAYEFLRNNALDARNFFDYLPAPNRLPPFKRNQFGASGGGPIRKDQTFIFADYEGIRQSKGVAQLPTVPTAAARTGDLSTGQVVVDPSVTKYLGFWPLPNLPVSPGSDTGQFAFTAQQVLSENFFTTRIDHKISDRDSIFGTYLYDNTPFTSPDRLDAVAVVSQTNRQVVALEESHIFGPALVNSIRAGYSRVGAGLNQGGVAINPLSADKSLGSSPGQNAAPVSVAGISGFSGGLGSLDRFSHGWNSFQGYDDAFLLRGTHSLKFGGAVERMDYNTIGRVNGAGNWAFGSLNNFLTNIPQSFQGAFVNTLSPRGYRETLFGAYIQDDWRWRPNLTLNVGLRYEMTTVPTEVQGKLSHLLTLTDAKPHLGSPLFSNPTLHNFEPRVGFSWDPFHNGKTAVRGGFGLFDVLPLPYWIELLEDRAAPFYLLGAVQPAPAGSFFSGGYPLLGVGSFSATYIEPHPHRNYVMQWNLDIQRALAPNLTLMVAYVGSRGVHQQFKVDDADMVIPKNTPQGYEWPVPQGSGTKINPNFGSLRAVFWSGNSYYDALEAGVTKRLSHGVQLQGSFTWGKSIDDHSGGAASDSYGNSLSSLHWYDLRLDKAVSDFNIGRTLDVSAVWQAPSPKWSSNTANWLLDGWELGFIYKVNDGVGVTPVLGGDPLGQNSSDPWDFPDRLSGPDCSSLVNPGNPNNYIKLQCFAFPNPVTRIGNSGRNIVIGPGLSNLDFSLFKNSYIKRISENFNAQFRVEFFNVLNRSNFQAPIDNNTIFDQSGNLQVGSAGVLDSTVTDAREIQFALKLIW
jgi:Carboxypeptidase regulatory-like domain/TonB dependent receptor-like, beta-barrel/TonB-dependent Receptor Plug Domain